MSFYFLASLDLGKDFFHEFGKLGGDDEFEGGEIRFVLLLAMMGNIGMLQSEVLICQIAESGSLGTQGVDVEGHFLRAVIFPSVHQHLEHHCKMVELAIENLVAECGDLFILLSL